MLCAFCSNIAGENTYTKTPVSEELLIMRDKYPNIKEMARNYRDYEEDEYNPKEYYKLKLLITLNGKEYVTDDVQIYLRENDKKQGIEWAVSERTELFLQYDKWYQLYVTHPEYGVINISIFTYLPPQPGNYVLPVDLKKGNEKEKAGSLKYDHRVNEMVFFKKNMPS